MSSSTSSASSASSYSSSSSRSSSSHTSSSASSASTLTRARLLESLDFIDAETKINCMAPHRGHQNHQRCWRSPPMIGFRKGIRHLEGLHGWKWKDATLERELVKAARGVLCKICREEGEAEQLAEKWMENDHVRSSLMDQGRPLEQPSLGIPVRTQNAPTQTKEPVPGRSYEEQAVPVDNSRDQAKRGTLVDQTISKGTAAAGCVAGTSSQGRKARQQKDTKTRGWKTVGVLGVAGLVFALASWLDVV